MRLVEGLFNELWQPTAATMAGKKGFNGGCCKCGVFQTFLESESHIFHREV
jgi:hypothetical protein